MRDLKAQLQLTADATGVEVGTGKAKRSLADLASAATAAGKQASEGLGKAGEGGDNAAKKVDAATRSIIGSIERTTARLDAGSASSSSYFRVLASQRGVDTGVLKPYLDQLDAVAAKQKVASAAITEGAKPLAEYTMSARATAAALRQVPAQFTDIVTSLQGGQKPLTVLLQQGGQLKDVFGGIGPAAKALGGYVLGLVNPFTIAAAAAGLLALAYNEGSKEADAYSKALILSGDASGATASQLQSIAKAISQVAGTQGNAAAAVAAFAESGNVAASGLQNAAQAAVVFERATGQAIGDTVKQFAELGKAPLDASLKLNESLRYLTLSTYSQIKALEDQGRLTDAARVAQNAYADAIESRGNQIEARLGNIAKLLKTIKDFSGQAVDAVLEVGRTATLQEQLAKVNEEIDKARKPFDASAFEGNAEARAKLQDNLALQASLTKQLQSQESIAKAAKATADTVQARIAFDKDGLQFLTNQAKAEREIAKARNEGAAAGATTAEIERRIADIREKYADKGAARTVLGIDKSTLASDLSAIKSNNEQLVDSYRDAEQRVESLRADGTLSEQEYFDAKRSLLRLESAAEQDRLQKTLLRLQQEKLAGRSLIDNEKAIAEALSKSSIAAATSASQLGALDSLQASLQRKRQAGYLADERDQQNALDATQRDYDLQLKLASLSDQEAARLAARAQIEERYRQDRVRAETQIQAARDAGINGRANDDEEEAYQKRLALLDKFLAESLKRYDANYAARQAYEENSAAGAARAAQNYIDEASKTGKLTEQAYTNAFASIEDSLVQFVTTGKFNFRSLANSIIADIARIQVKSALASVAKGSTGGGSFLGLIGGVLGAFAGTGGNAALASSLPGDSLDNFLALYNNFSGPRALGGPVSAGGLYRVNERGPEMLESGGRQYLMMGSQGGNVVPNGGGSSGLTIINNTRGTIDNAKMTTLPSGERALILDEAVSRVAASFSDPNSAISRAQGRSYKGLQRNR